METGYAQIMNGRGASDSERPGGARGCEADPEVPAAGAVDPPDEGVDPCNRRSSERVDVHWSVDCETEDTFLYAAITNISEMGIFVRTTEPLAVGTTVILRFAPPHESEPFVLGGTVQWVNALRPRESNPNPGMGIRFATLTPADRERIVDTIRTIAYLREEPRPLASRSEPPGSRNVSN